MSPCKSRLLFFIPIGCHMSITPPERKTTKSTSASSRRPHGQRLLQRIHDAVTKEHFGIALSILKQNPVLRLPDYLAHDLVAKLRQRGQHDHVKQIVGHIGSSGTAVDLLSVEQKNAEHLSEPSEFQSHVVRLARNGKLRECFGLLDSSPSETLSPHALEALLKTASRSAHASNAHHVLHVLFPRYGLAPTALAFACFVDACGRGGNLKKALSILSNHSFTSLSKPEQTVVYEKLIDACIRCNSFKRAQSLLNRMIQSSVPRTQTVYDCLLSASGTARQVDDSLAVLSQMRTDGFSAQRITTYNALIRSSARAGKFGDAMKVYNSLRESPIEPNLDTFNAVLSSFARAAQPDKALNTLYSMRQKENLKPNAVSYNWVVNACARAGNVDRAFQVARTMRDEGIRLNVVTYNNLLQACCKAGLLERAFAMVKNMIQKEGIHPNSHTYDTLIQGCGRWGELDAALRLFHSMRKAGVAPTIVTYSIAIDACAKGGGAVAVDQAFELLNEMKRSGLEPNLVTYNSLIHACARAKRIDLAFNILNYLRKDRIVPDIVTLCSLVDACGRSGDISRAFQVIEQLPREFPSIKPNVPVYNALIYACFKADDFKRMRVAHDTMQTRGLQSNVVTYSTLITAYATKGHTSEAVTLLKQMQENGLRPNKLTFTSIIAGYGKVGKVDLAMKTLEESRCMWGQPDEELYTAAIVAAIGSDRKETALKLAKEMNLAGYSVPLVLNRMIRNVGDRERSGAELRSMLSAMEALDVRPQRMALETIVKAYAEEADVSSAFGVLPDMQRLGYPPNLQTYRTLIHACMLSKNPAHIRRARALFRKVRSTIKDGDPHLRSHRWRDLYEAIIRAVDKVPDPLERSKLLRAMFQSMAKDCGETHACSLAMRVFPEIVKRNDLNGD
eukprot:TRINITY_DN444_c6_g1_i1.p1 TRINITY_DN444_c6_g1~~TRINITY_DN444_c6_g1_i1.p1  ORF type:complete len:902 (+),score=108.60 TRINITY_DN444_c6_g1_i1:11124-13829(+)